MSLGHMMSSRAAEGIQTVGPIISTASRGCCLTLWRECFLTMTVGLPASFQGYLSPSLSEHNF